MENFNTTAFSYFEYKSSCGGAPLRVPIEPLVGLMRHPLVIGACAAEPGTPSMVETRHDAVGMLLYMNRIYLDTVNPKEQC